MKLTPIRKQDASAGTAEASSAIAIDPSTIQTMGIRTAEVTRGPLRRLIRTVANVDYDETALADVTTKYKGWIEKLYVDATGALVNPGDPLFEIYSPELYSAQTEYLAALSAVGLAFRRRPRPARQRPEQIEILRHLGRADRGTGKNAPGDKDADDHRAHQRVCGRKKCRCGTDGGFRHEALPAGGHRRRVGLCAGLRAGFVRRPARPGGDDDAVVSARPQIPRAGHLYLPDGGRENAHGAGAHGVPQSRLFSQAGHVCDGGTGGGHCAVGIAGAGFGGVAQRPEEHGFHCVAGRKIRGAHRRAGIERGKRPGPGAQRPERRRAGGHVRPVHARFGKPVARGDPENERTPAQRRRRQLRRAPAKPAARRRSGPMRT